MAHCLNINFSLMQITLTNVRTAGLLLSNTARNMCITSFSCDFYWAIHLLYYLFIIIYYIYYFIILLYYFNVIFKVSFIVKNSISRSSEQKYNFLTNKARNMCNNTSLLCSFEDILIIQGHLQGQKVNFKVKLKKSFNNKARNMCNTSFSWDFD